MIISCSSSTQKNSNALEILNRLGRLGAGPIEATGGSQSKLTGSTYLTTTH